MNANQAPQSNGSSQANWIDRCNQDSFGRLAANGRRRAAEQSEPVDLSHLITAAVRRAVGDWEDKMLLQLPEGVFVQGPADDLRDLIIALSEHACTRGCDKVEFRGQVNYTIDCGRPSCTAEIISPMPELSDYLRRELWEVVVGKRGGRVSMTSGTEYNRIEFTLPLERRLGTILG